MRPFPSILYNNGSLITVARLYRSISEHRSETDAGGQRSPAILLSVVIGVVQEGHPGSCAEGAGGGSIRLLILPAECSSALRRIGFRILVSRWSESLDLVCTRRNASRRGRSQTGEDAEN